LVGAILAAIVVYSSGAVPTFNQMVDAFFQNFLAGLVIGSVVVVLIAIFYFLSQR